MPAVFRRTRFLEGRDVDGTGAPEVGGVRPDGRRMTERDWRREDAHTLGVSLNGDAGPSRTRRGEPVSDSSFLLLFNAHYEPMDFTLPPRRFGRRWAVEIDTAQAQAEPVTVAPRAVLRTESRSVVVLRAA